MRPLILLTLAACAAPPPPVAPAPAPRKDVTLASFAEPYRFTSAHPVEHYGEALHDPPSSPFEDEVIAATHAVADPRLSRACRDLLAVAATGARLPNAAVAHAWSSAGIVEPGAPIVVHATDAAQVATQVIAALGTVPAGSRLGLARDGSTVVAVVTQPRLVVEPFARHVPADGSLSIAGTLVGHPADLAIDVHWQDHANMQIVPTRKRDHFAAQISCQGRPGRGDVVITGVEATTQTVLARFPVWCGDAPSSEIVIDPLVDDGGDIAPEAASHRMFLRLQRDRVAARLPTQSWDDVAAKAAAARAEDLRDAFREARAVVWRHAELPAPKAISNIMTASSVDAAYTKIMADPTRRANSMHGQMDAGAIGIARDPGSGQVFVVEIFMDMTSTPVSAPTPEAIAEQIVALDHDLQVVPRLANTAQQLAVMLRAGGSKADMLEVISRAAGEEKPGESANRGIQISNIFYNTVTTVGVRREDILSLAAHQDIVDYFGVGVVRGYDRKINANAIWVVVVLAQASGLPRTRMP